MDVLFGGMLRIGHRATWLLAGAAAATVPAVVMWGFTVDDALISVRYARHLAAGMGWRFNAGGPITDGVTPLAWPLVLLPVARAGALGVLLRAKLFGLLLWAVTGAWLGASIATVHKAPLWARAAVLATVALSVPLAAHAVTGMETPLATALATGAALCAPRVRWAAVLAGLAASLRPEMAPWACVLAAGLALGSRLRSWRVIEAVALALAPFALCVVVRLAVWGRPAPLAVLAKPGDVVQGLAYAGMGCVTSLVPLLVVAPMALRCSPAALAVVLAFVAHLAAIVLVGGDWMPFFRLLVPALPSLAWAAVLVSAQARRRATAVRTAVALGLGLLGVGLFVVRPGAAGRGVMADRAALISSASSWLDDVHRVAALDVGWVGAATDADVLDLAGVTDPEIAALPGGHTSKRVGAMLLLSRHVDAILLYAPQGLPDDDLDAWRDAAYPRVVEARLAADDVIARHFTPAAWLPLGAGPTGYVLLRENQAPEDPERSQENSSP
jgi:hypothetical protein